MRRRRIMPIQWEEELATGIDAIDEQHKEIFARFAVFSSACGDGGGKDELARLMLFLEEYTNRHFEDEEEALAKAEYPDLSLQRTAHRNFSENVAELRRKVDEREPDMAEIMEMKRML